MNKIIITILFVGFALFVLFTSLQTVSTTQNAVENAKTRMQGMPLPTVTSTPVVSQAPLPLPVQRPGFRVRGGELEEGDD